MSKILASFQAAQTSKAALAVVKHANRHPMALCMLTKEESAILATARAMAAGS